MAALSVLIVASHVLALEYDMGAFEIGQTLLPNQVPFIQSEGFVEELMRFLSSPRGGTHDAHRTWSLQKRQKTATILSR